MVTAVISDFASEDEGATILLATSSDDRYPAENILDGKDSTFWATTGLYPQEFIVAFAKTAHLTKLKTLTTNVRKLLVERCQEEQPTKWEKVFEIELSDRSGRLQTEVHQVNVQARYLKFVINSGWDDFCTVHRVSCEGADFEEETSTT